MIAQVSSVRSLRWLSESQQVLMTTLMTGAMQSVVDEWRCGSETHGTTFHFVHADVANGNGVLFDVDSTAGRLLSIQLLPDTLRQLVNLPLGSSVSAADGEALLTSLVRDFVEAIALRIVPASLTSGLRVRPGIRTAESADRHSHQLLELISDRHTSLGMFIVENLLLEHLAHRASRPVAETITRRVAIGSQLLSVTAYLGSVELPFPALQSLATGDVLVLKSSLSEPITLRNETGQLVATGSLGRQDQQRVVRLTSVATGGQIDRMNTVKRSGR